MSDATLWTPPPDPEREASVKAIIEAELARTGWGPFFIDGMRESGYIMADGSLEIR